MAYIEPRKNKNGIITSYRIVVSGGIASGGKQKKYSMTFKPSPNMTEKQIQKQLNEIAVDFERQCKNGIAGDCTKITLSEFIPQYLETVKNSLAPETFEMYSSVIDIYIAPVLGQKKLPEIKPVHVQEWLDQLQTVKTKSGMLLAPSSIIRYYTVFKHIFSHAVKIQLIDKNPADKSKLTLPKLNEKETEVFTKAECKRIIEHLTFEPLQFQVMIQLAIYSGARRGELVALRFSDIDFKNCIIKISNSAYKVTGEKQGLKAPKSGKARYVSVSAECIELVKELQAEKERSKVSLGSAFNDNGFLFTQDNGEMIHTDTPSKQFKNFLDKCGINHGHFHVLRHTSATMLLYTGADITTVRQHLGHSSISVTNRYTHALKGVEGIAVQRMADFINDISDDKTANSVKQA